MTMNVRRHKRERPGFESNSDIISHLPVELIENILGRLPIKEIIRTSILSSRWKYKWTSIPDLVFNEDSLGCDLIRFVDMVLSAHQGPILTFQLDCVSECSEAVDRWMPILSQNGITDLRLCFGIYAYCMIASSLFSCHKLKHLEISNCFLNVHQFFQGFKFLRTLKLSACELIGVTIEKLVSTCPLLETLELPNFRGDGFLFIHAPNLRKFSLHGWFNNISFETPKLISVSIVLCSIIHGPMIGGSESKLWSVFDRLPNIEELEIGGRFATYLSSGHTQKKLPVTYYCLKKLTMYLCSSSMKGLEVALCIFRSAPNLKTLNIALPRQDIWEDQRTTAEVSFKHLEVVKILYFVDAVSMVGFAKFLLSTAPMLEKLIIDIYSVEYFYDKGLALLRKLASLPKLCTKVVISVEGVFFN